MILELLGPSLEDLLQYNKKPFYPSLVLAIGEQMVNIIKGIKNWIFAF